MNISGLNNNYNLKQNYTLNKQSYSSPASAPSKEINFKGGKESKLGKWISEFYGKHYGKPMYDKKWIQDASEKMTKFPGQMTEHMATLGSILTSGVYMYRTLTNKDLDADKRKTLAINQGLCCLIPTIGAYTVSNKMAKFKKNVEYRYRGLKEQQVALGQISEQEAKVLKEKLGTNLKGLGALTGLATFTLIYRYLTPVIVTPVANWMGNKLNAKDDKQKAITIEMKPAAQETAIQPKAKEIALNPNKEYRQSA